MVFGQVLDFWRGGVRFGILCDFVSFFDKFVKNGQIRVLLANGHFWPFLSDFGSIE